EADGKEAIIAALAMPTPDRLLVIAQAFRHGLSIAEVHAACKYDPWFLEQIEELVTAERRILEKGLPQDANDLRSLKRMGFSDARLAELAGRKEAEIAADRRRLGVLPVFKRVDTCAAEFESRTPYMYSTYEAGAEAECEAQPQDRRKV